MKTSTITFHAPNNNGSFLQAYALQKVLEERFCVENRIIDYQSEKQVNQYSVFRKAKTIRDVAKNVISLMHYKAMKEHNRKFSEMRQQYLRMTERCSSVEKVAEIANTFDLVIAGSDQIWNTEAPDFSEAYILPGVSTKKVAYAVSLGKSFKKTDIAQYSLLINSFDAVSIRDASVKPFFEKQIQQNVEVVLDPTLLLDKQDYEFMMNQEQLELGEYILFYSISFDEESMKVARRIAQRLHIKIVTVFTSFHTVASKKYGMDIRYDAGPSEFLSLLKHAKLVLTNSFHGTAFSIIMNKPFYHIYSTANGRILRDDRITSLLDVLKLTNCQAGITCIPEDIPIVDWENVNAQRDDLKKHSLEFLSRALEIGSEIK